MRGCNLRIEEYLDCMILMMWEKIVKINEILK